MYPIGLHRRIVKGVKFLLFPAIAPWGTASTHHVDICSSSFITDEHFIRGGHQRVREHLCGVYEFLETKKMENLQELERKNS